MPPHIAVFAEEQDRHVLFGTFALLLDDLADAFNQHDEPFCQIGIGMTDAATASTGRSNFKVDGTGLVWS